MSVFLFEGCSSGVCASSLGPGSSWRSSVVSVGAADVFNPSEWAQNSWVFLIDWSQDGASPRLEESAQKTLAEAVCFHVEDFGEAGSLLQSLKQKGREGDQSLVLSKETSLIFVYTSRRLHAFMFSTINSVCGQWLMCEGCKTVKR